ncbi:MAG: hypothetical protein ABI551_12610 [Polyangiaceae bacterium]
MLGGDRRCLRARGLAGLELAAIGTVSALAGYAFGALFRAPV